MWLFDMIAKVIGYAVLMVLLAVVVVYVLYFIRQVYCVSALNRKYERLHREGKINCLPSRCQYCKAEREKELKI